jgi:hypothetical protein
MERLSGNKAILLLLFNFMLCWILSSCQSQFKDKRIDKNRINLAGEWAFQVDSLDVGVQESWYRKVLKEEIQLPGSMTTNGKGDNISLETPWTGSIWDSSYFHKAEYAKYRKPDNIKVPFWLQPVKYYKGAAWYQKEVTVPDAWADKYVELFIERSHWETTVWVDDQLIGMRNSLGTPHVFDLSEKLTPGTHNLTVRVDNRVKEFNVGINSHSITDHTQTNWNGMIGDLFIAARPALYIDDVQLYPDVKNKRVVARIKVNNKTGATTNASIELVAESNNDDAIDPLSKNINIQDDYVNVEMVYPMGDVPLLWDEFNPNLYSMQVRLTGNGKSDEKKVTFGMREFSTRGTQFTINGKPVFLRGTMEGAIFPKTGYPPTDVEEWMRIFKICKSYGLNHMRFHSWCPPEAAFEAADQLGFYLQIEASSWANQGSSIGDDNPIDKYIYDESQRMIKAYGNHPSLCMMAYGNEPGGDNQVKYLTDFVNYWKKEDDRFLITTGSGWPVVAESDFNSTPKPRIQRWGEGLKSIINQQPPQTDYDWSKIIAPYDQPTVSHEIGQWCVYPNFKEIPKYDGVVKPKNFEIFQERLKEHGMAHLADSFLLASGKLQVLCYKADIEAALRTPDFGGFQLLDLHDFPGQGTALVGVLDPFWEDKGYVTAEEYSQFCNSTVPLVRLPKMVYLNNEELIAPVEIAHYGPKPLKNVVPEWTITHRDGAVFAEGKLPETNIPLQNGYKLGTIQKSLKGLENPENLKLTVTVNDFENSWDIWVYPAQVPSLNESKVRVTQVYDQSVEDYLQKGGAVLLTLPKGSLKADKGGDVAVGFSSIFWNTAWTRGQAPHTLGILCNPEHPALQAFPTKYHSDWQWWDAMSHSNAIRLDAVSSDLQPIVRVIDDWFTARPLGLLFECKVGNGKLLVSGIDLLSHQDKRPEARQLLYSLKKYISSSDFNPESEVTSDLIKSLTTNNIIADTNNVASSIIN